jgi:hypothetical protein
MRAASNIRLAVLGSRLVPQIQQAYVPRVLCTSPSSSDLLLCFVACLQALLLTPSPHYTAC